MTITQALRLADELENFPISVADHAAAELRRLHYEVLEQCRINGMGAEREARLMAVNQMLLEACIATDVWLSSGAGTGFENKIRAAIAKATEKNETSD